MPNETGVEWVVEARLVHPTQGFAGPRRLRLAERALFVLDEREERGLRIPHEFVLGLRQGAVSVELMVAGGSLTLTTRDDVARCGRALAEALAPFPAFAPRLPRYGSARGGDPDGQQRFFAPVFSARDRALRADPILPRITAFRAEALTEAYERLRGDLAGPVPDGAERRARMARLDDLMSPVARAIAHLVQTGETIVQEGEVRSIVGWRTWTGAVEVLLAALDSSWRQIAGNWRERSE